MPYLHVIVPSRNRPHAVLELTEAFRATCAMKHFQEQTRLTFVVDEDDPQLPAYQEAIRDLAATAYEGVNWAASQIRVPVSPSLSIHLPSGGELGTGVVAPLNRAAQMVTASVDPNRPAGIVFMGDDHRPRTAGWDERYLAALDTHHIVYGNDLFQGPNLPTQAAVRTTTVEALGYFFPPELKHLYADNYLLALGHTLQSIQYLPDVHIEHMHPAAGKAVNDENYQRVNAPAIDSHDEEVFRTVLLPRIGDDARRVMEYTPQS